MQEIEVISNSPANFQKKLINGNEKSENDLIKEFITYAQSHGYYPNESQFYRQIIQDELSWQEQQI